MTARTAFRCTLAFLATLLLSISSHAELFRAYLAPSPAGNDSNPCTLPAPCRLLPAALSAVADGGEIWMLDSANYNTATVNITKSVSILAVPGAVGSVVAAGGPAISIAARSLKVALRNLVIVPLAGGGGTDGISMTGASTLFVEYSLIANLPGSGVIVAGAGKVKIADTIIRNNGTYGVWLQDGATGDISTTKLLGNALGVLAYGLTATTTMVSVSDSIISEGTVGVYALTTIAGAVAKIFVTRCTIVGTRWALDSENPGGGSALVVVGNSMITNNYYGWYQSGAGTVIRSLGNNLISDNTTTVGSLTPLAPQ
jgi:hypothetical protein